VTLRNKIVKNLLWPVYNLLYKINPNIANNVKVELWRWRVGQRTAPIERKIKKAIKKKFLWPVYDIVYKINSRLATKIKIKLWEWYTWHQINCHGTDNNNGISRILIDSTYTSRVNDNGGIQRVVRNIGTEIINSGKEYTFVQLIAGKLITNYEYMYKLKNEKYNGLEKKVIINQGDVLFLLDPTWDRYSEFLLIINQIHEKNGKVIAIIHDLFPIQYPQLFESASGRDVFKLWHEMIIQNCDQIVCDSRTTIIAVLKYLSNNNRSIVTELFYFHLGATISNENKKKEVREYIKNIFDFNGKIFLMVGTVEPRKGHDIVVKAIEKILAQRKNVKLLIIGHDGWKNDTFLLHLKRSKYYNDKVIWINDATDDEVIYSYIYSDCLIAASQDEGFGLPLIEAAHFGLPIICSDIPIFHEVAGGNVTYFPVMDTEALVQTLISWLKEEKHPDSNKIKIYTWAESAQEILNIMDDKVKPYKILQ